MLLSFAQFEREVTGERIRDKIAASKQRGMWMGGLPPLGYNSEDRKLVVNTAEAETVRGIFRRYTEVRSVRALKDDLHRDGIVSKVRIDRHGRQTGAKPIGRGALYCMLQNRIYRGEIVHKDKAYPGLHEAIVDAPLWDEVQAALTENRVERVARSTAANPSLLRGLVFDANGERMSPTHAVKNAARYRYYASQALIKGGRRRASEAACRVPAADLEMIVEDRLCTLLRNETAVLEAAGSASVASRKALIDNAARLADRWPSLSAPAKYAILRTLIARIDIYAETVDIAVQPKRCPRS
jgi:hypothetical protein